MMKPNLPSAYRLSAEVDRALETGRPVVALESTVITHGLPHPENLELALDMEATVRQEQGTPATIAVIDGLVYVGVSPAQLERLSRDTAARKISRRDFAPAIAQKASGGTTVAGTLLAAAAAGIRVFATGGIGGVHRQPAYDVSTDLPQLARTPMIVVCAGAKAILDLPATLEYLETAGVPVVGYQTSEFPAFYSPSSGLSTSARADSPAEVAAIAQAHWRLGLDSAVLVAVPPPETAMQPQDMQAAIQAALQEAEAQGIRGQQSTPFLLKRVSELSHGASLKANLGLLKNNARVAAQIAREMAKGSGWQPA